MSLASEINNTLQEIKGLLYKIKCAFAEARTFSFGAHVSGAPIATGFAITIIVPYDCRVIGWSVYEVSETPISGEIYFSLQHFPYADYATPLPAGTTMEGTDPPYLSAEVKRRNFLVTDWTVTTLTGGDVIRVLVMNATDVEEVKVLLHVTKL